jgi:hypothetical protein
MFRHGFRRAGSVVQTTVGVMAVSFLPGLRMPQRKQSRDAAEIDKLNRMD